VAPTRGNRGQRAAAAAALLCVLLGALPVLGGCAPAGETVDELKQEKDELVQRLADLGADRDRLQAELNALKQRAEELLGALRDLGWTEEAGAPDLAITNVAVVTANVDAEGRIWGEFAVEVTVQNRGMTDSAPVSVGAVLLATNSRYQSLAPDVSAACRQVESIEPGGEATVTLTGLSTRHPELNQQILVTVYGLADEQNQANNVRRLALRARFAPGSAD